MKTSDIQNLSQSGNGRILWFICIWLGVLMSLVGLRIYFAVDEQRSRLHSETIDRYQEKYNGSYLRIVTNLITQYATDRNGSLRVDCSDHSLRPQILVWDITDYFDHKLLDTSIAASYLRNLYHGYGQPFVYPVNNYTGSVFLTEAQADIMVRQSHPLPDLLANTNKSLSVIFIEETIFKDGPEYTEEKWHGIGSRHKYGGIAAWLTIYTWPERELICRSFIYPFYPDSFVMGGYQQFSWRKNYESWLLNMIPLQGTHTNTH